MYATKSFLLIFVYIILNMELIKLSRWSLEQSAFSNYTVIKEEETGLVIAEFPAVDHYTAQERSLNLNSLVDKHNKLVELFNQQAV